MNHINMIIHLGGDSFNKTAEIYMQKYIGVIIE